MSGIETIKLDALSAAKHEIGHALVQALFTIGPVSLRIEQRYHGGWEGESRPEELATSEEFWARMMASQIAGPICQICLAPESLGEFQDHFLDTLLKPSIALLSVDKEALNKLLWGEDLLSSPVIFFAKRSASMPLKDLVYFDGGFLYRAERILFEIFRDSRFRDDATALASRLVDQKTLPGDTFRHLASDTLQNAQWKALLEMDWDIPINFKK